MICDFCCHTGKCLQSNPSREEVCKDFVPLCKACYYNKVEIEHVVKKVREGKKLVEKTVPIQKHYCAMSKLPIEADEFCSKGKKIK